SSINVGARYSSLLQNRGVIFYRDYQIDPIFSVFMFDDRLEFLGDSLGYRDFIYKDSIRLRTRVMSITDNALFPDNKSISDGNFDREDSFEWVNGVEFFLPGYSSDFFAEIDL